MKIVVLDGYALNPGDISWNGFKRLGDFVYYDRTVPDQVAIRIGAAEAAITNKTPLTEDVMAACPNLKYIGVLATGYNVVDLVAAGARGITVTNIPAYGTAAVAQFVFALLLEVCHHVGHHAETVRRGRWSASKDFCYWDFPLIELHGKAMGIIGFGRIGQAVSAIAVAMGMKVLAYDEHVDRKNESASVHYAGLDEVLSAADVLSLHVPLFDSTKEMINASSIAKMKDGVIIVNTSRGPLVREDDMATALASRKVYAYAADVASIEPIVSVNPLLSVGNSIITPHIAWAPRESRTRLMNIAVDNLAAYVRGEPRNVVSGN